MFSIQSVRALCTYFPLPYLYCTGAKVVDFYARYFVRPKTPPPPPVVLKKTRRTLFVRNDVVGREVFFSRRI